MRIIVSMTTLSFHFQNMKEENRCVPYIREEEPVDYICDGKMGSICFDGYFYVEDHAPPYPDDAGKEPWECDRRRDWLPKTLYMTVNRTETEPYKVEGNTSYYRTVEQYQYMIEVYKRIIHKSTDKYSEVEEDDGEIMNVCFFPTNKQTLYFRVLETLN